MRGAGVGVEVTVLVPGFLPPPPSVELRLRGLELLLSRGESVRQSPVPFEQLLFGIFGIAAETGDLPVAAVTRMVDMGVVDQEWWIRADPVHLAPRRDGLVLVPSEMANLDGDEARRLCEELARHYTAEGWLLRAPHPWRWYLRPPRAPEIRTTPLSLAAGRDIHGCLPTGPDARQWHTLLNEMQILLHSAQVNVERERRGDLSINSLWFWGGGRLPDVSGSEIGAVWADDVLARGLGRLSGVATNPVPAGFETWYATAQPGRHLIVLDGLQRAVRRDIEAGWGVGLADLENVWFRPLAEALRSGAIAQLSLATDQGLSCRATGRQLRRWWRRRRPLSDFTPSQELPE